MAYGASIPDLCHRVATYVDKIQTGVKPRELPLEPASQV
jgi:hypothetical protein